jgi:integrase/recombinase XerD
MKINKKEVTTSIVLRKNYATPEGLHPIKLRVTFNRDSKYYPVNSNGRPVFLNPDSWNATQERKVPKDLRDTSALFNNVQALAETTIEKITRDGKIFTWENFEREFLQQHSFKGFLSLFREHLQTIKGENRIGTYKSYLNAYNAFKAFRKDRELSPFDISVQLLKSFDAFLAGRGCNKTSIGIYLRSLKVIYNLAADTNPALLENYPFARKQTDRNRYKIRTGSGHKGDALTLSQLQSFISIKTDPESPEHEARQLWLFSFYCQGMNMKDIALLKYRDIQGDLIRYVRAKTRDTEVRESAMEIPLTDPIRSIILDIGNPDKRQSSHVFTIIPNGLASKTKRRIIEEKTHEERIDEIIRQKIKMVNSRLRAICEASNVDELKDLKMTTYWARHSFASLLKESGESVEMIRELLGHSDIRTTENYLKRFDLQKKHAVSLKVQSILKAS